MAQLCEIEGTLLCKKLMGWNTYYCVIYNGIFSSFKDINSPTPELQASLTTCRVIIHPYSLPARYQYTPTTHYHPCKNTTSLTIYQVKIQSHSLPASYQYTPTQHLPSINTPSLTTCLVSTNPHSLLARYQHTLTHY